MHLLYVTHSCFFDAEQAGNRALMRALVEQGAAVEVLSGVVLGGDHEEDPTRRLADRGYLTGRNEELVPVAEQPGPLPPHLSARDSGVPVVIHLGPSTRSHNPEDGEREGFLRLLDAMLDRRPTLLVVGDAGELTASVLDRARLRGVVTAAQVPNFVHREPPWFRATNALLVSSVFASRYYRDAFGLACAVLPCGIDPKRVRTDRDDSGYVTFVDPTVSNGVFAFARIADELGRCRPDIPLLVVEGEATESSLSSCGVDLRPRGNIQMMSPTSNPKDYWRVTRIALLPNLGLDSDTIRAAEALSNGIPVVGSDRGELPEAVGEAGLVLPLPERLTPATRHVPGPDEVRLWVKAIIRLWDDRAFAEATGRLGVARSKRWDPKFLGPRCFRILSDLAAAPDPRRSRPAVAGGSERDRSLATTRSQTLAAAIIEAARAARGSDRGFPCVPLTVEWGGGRGSEDCRFAPSGSDAPIVRIGSAGGNDEAGLVGAAVGSQTSDIPNRAEGGPAHRRIVLAQPVASGLQTLADLGLDPGSIVLPPGQDAGIVTEILELTHALFPMTAVVVGDCDDAVRDAVAEHARRFGSNWGRSGLRGWEVTNRPPPNIQLSSPPRSRARSIVLVPHLNGIDWECEQGLRRLESAGVRVWRRGGSSAIDAARNVMASDSLHDGYESMIFIDADLGFDAPDVLRLLARPEPVLSGVYPKKARRELATYFGPDIPSVLFGPQSEGLYPANHVATGFLKFDADVLRRMIEVLALPLCNTKWGKGIWPFFMPMIVPHEIDKVQYLGEDWAFSHRLIQVGITPLVDTSIRLWHWGRYPYGWEDAGQEIRRYRSYNYQLK